MEFNPHSLNQILLRIRDQMRCPQCGTGVQVDFPAIKLASDNFMILELKCDACMSFIVLHVNMLGKNTDDMSNSELFLGESAMPSMTLSEDEMGTLRSALQSYEGSFEKMFQKHGKKKV
ncbi:MAG: hypothetical protein ABL890_03785 [Candidatus Peribacteraceae bacterium]